MEDFRQSRNSSPSSRCSSRANSRSHTPSRLGANDTILSVPVLEVPQLENSLNLLNATTAADQDSDSSNTNSKETSFIAHKRKGKVETV